MIAGIHQLHYFPWMGWLDKMAKSDAFVILDDVQLNDASYMFRHLLLDKNGEKKYITIPFNKKGYMDRKYSELELNAAVDWQTRQKNFIRDSYRKHPYFDEIWERIDPVFTGKYERLIEVTQKSVDILRDIFEIDTPLVFQSKLDIPDTRKSEFLINILHQIGADRYLSGNGARKYMDMQMFEDAGIHVVYQQFKLPEYPQKNSAEFVPGISSLDLLFNCGIEESRRIFRENLKLGHENEE